MSLKHKGKVEGYKAPWEIFDRKIKIVIVGCGRIAKNHVDAIYSYPDDFELVGLVDSNKEALKNFPNNTKIKCYTDLRECISETQPDVTVLCTPSGLHAKQTFEATSLSSHVITEKPMAVKWYDGLGMVSACKYQDVRLFVVKQNRLNPTIQYLKQAITDNRFGKIYLIVSNVFWTRPQSYYDQGKWRGTWQMDGGAYMNQASHYVDLLSWLGGPVASVYASMATLARNIETEDTGILTMRYRSGALGSLNVTMLTYPKNLEGSITVLGEKGTVRIGGMALNAIEKWEFADHEPEDDVIRSANYETNSVYGHGHKAYYKNIIDVFRGKASPLVSGDEGLKSLEILIAAYRSARDRKEIGLPLEL